MAPDLRRPIAAFAAGLAFATTPAAHAQAPAKAVAEAPMLDPWVPPALQKELRPAAPASRGAALAAEAEARLRRDFEAAAGPGGTLTRAQAAASGMGFVARHFEAIDRERRGAVRFEDLRRFLAVR